MIKPGQQPPKEAATGNITQNRPKPARADLTRIESQTDNPKISNPKESQHQQKAGIRGYLAYDIVHTVEFSRIGHLRHRVSRPSHRGNFTTLPLARAVSSQRPELEAREPAQRIERIQKPGPCSSSGFSIVRPVVLSRKGVALRPADRSRLRPEALRAFRTFGVTS